MGAVRRGRGERASVLECSPRSAAARRQAAIAHGVLDAVRAGDIPKKKANDPGIIVSVWLDPSIVEAENDPEILFRTNREATAKAIGKAMRHEPSIDWLLANQGEVPYYFHQLAVDGQL